MNNFKIKELKNSEDFDPNIVFEDITFTQTDYYGKWQQGTERIVRRFVIIKGEEIVAYFQLIKYPLLLGKSYLYIPYGPLTKDHSPEFFQNLKQKIKHIAKSEKAVFVRLDFNPVISDDILSKYFTKASLCTYHSAFFQPRTEWFLGLTKSETGILAEMHEKTRYSIRLAERKQITSEIIAEDFDKYFDVFFGLMDGTAKRNGFSLHKKDYYQNIFKNLPKGKAYLSIAKFGDKVLAIDLIIICGKVANYVFGGSSNEERNRMPTYLAQWRAIVEAKKFGCDYYNFGGIAGDGKVYDGWEGLTAFKKKFGGEAVHHSNFYDVVVNQFWYRLYNFRKCLKKIKK